MVGLNAWQQIQQKQIQIQKYSCFMIIQSNTEWDVRLILSLVQFGTLQLAGWAFGNDNSQVNLHEMKFTKWSQVTPECIYKTKTVLFWLVLTYCAELV